EKEKEREGGDQATSASTAVRRIVLPSDGAAPVAWLVVSGTTRGRFVALRAPLGGPVFPQGAGVVEQRRRQAPRVGAARVDLAEAGQPGGVLTALRGRQ